MLTGDRPTGRLHLGHYFGTIRERVTLQDLGVTSRILIADYQVITDRDTTEPTLPGQRATTWSSTTWPAASTRRRPSSSLTPQCRRSTSSCCRSFPWCTEAELLRNPTVKAEQEASGHALTGLLLTYPVHQACDILFCKGNIVPVGKDQLPHIEQTRQIARRFNERYGHVFPEPEGLLDRCGGDPRPGRSQDVEVLRQRHHACRATPEETAKLIKKSQTDSERFITFDHENRPGVSRAADDGGAVPRAATRRRSPPRLATSGSGAAEEAT